MAAIINLNENEWVKFIFVQNGWESTLASVSEFEQEF